MVAVAVIAALAAVLLDRLLYLEEQAEKTAMESAVQTIRAGLRYRLAELLGRGDARGIARLAAENPMGWMDRPPAGYRGEFAGRAPAADEAQWYYDTERRELAYRPRLTRYLRAPGGDGAEIRFRVVALPRDAVRETAQWAVLEPVEPYRWF